MVGMSVSTPNDQQVVDFIQQRLDKTWRDQVENVLRDANAGYDGFDGDRKFRLILEYILCTDLRHFWKGQCESSEPTKSVRFVQVEGVQDISQPVKQRYGRSNNDGKEEGPQKRRMLKMMLFDGQRQLIGIEHESLPFQWPLLGAKIIIDPHVLEVNGMMLLTPKTCGYLGGVVKEFEARQKMVQEVVQKPVYGRRGPPMKLEEFMKNVTEEVTKILNLEHQREIANAELREYVLVDSDSDDDWGLIVPTQGPDVNKRAREEALVEEVVVEDAVVIDDEPSQSLEAVSHHVTATPAVVQRTEPSPDHISSTFEALKRRKAMREQKNQQSSATK